MSWTSMLSYADVVYLGAALLLYCNFVCCVRDCTLVVPCVFPEKNGGRRALVLNETAERAVSLMEIQRTVANVMGGTDSD